MRRGEELDPYLSIREELIGEVGWDPDSSEVLELTSTPDHTMTNEEVAATEFEYSTRDPVTDRIISGPLGGHGSGPGRHFARIGQAMAWAKEKYGKQLLGRVPEATKSGGNRWAVLVRFPNLKENA